MLACELCKPLFLHERDAHKEMVEILVKYSERSVVHSSDENSHNSPRTLQIAALRHPLLHWDQRAGTEIPGARLLYWSHWLPLEGQVRERSQKNSGGRNHSPGQTSCWNRCPIHVSQHQGQQTAPTYQGLSHGEICHFPPTILHLSSKSWHQLRIVNIILIFFQRNEPCSLPVTVEMIAAYLNKTPEEVALATTFNALKVFGLSG